MSQMTYTLQDLTPYTKHLGSRGLSDNTIKSYVKDVRAFLVSCDGHVDAEDFQEFAIDWLHLNRRRSLSPATVARNLASLKSFARFGSIPNTLSEYKAPEAGEVNPHPLPEGVEGVRRMLAAADTEEHACIIGLCGLAGLRIGETLTIRASSIDLEQMKLKIVGKGNKTRRVPISPELWDVIERAYYRSRLQTDDAPLISIVNRSARKAVTTIGKRAHLSRRVSSHDLRATFATELYNRGVSTRIIQMLLGHAHLNTTEVYLGVNESDMQAAVVMA